MNTEVKKTEKKTNWKQTASFALLVLIGIAGGYLFGYYLGNFMKETGIAGLLYLVIVIVSGFFLQIILHEGGHLVFGLLTGYQFCSFRIGNVILTKEQGKWKLSKYSLAGTGGQCLMIPPKHREDGSIPYVWYNLGGCISNLLFGLMGVLLYIICKEYSFAAFFFAMFAIFGILFCITNGLPIQSGGISTDGYNALQLGKNQEALEALCTQLNINAQAAKGVRLKDMPEEWFEVSSEEALKNGMIAALAVFHCQRLIDEHNFEEAAEEIECLLEMETGMAGLYRHILTIERIYCELVLQNRFDVIDGMMTKELKVFAKQMQNFPSVIRTNYAYALLSEKNLDKAEQYKEQFEKVEKNYPYPEEMKAELELMQCAYHQYCELYT